MILTSFFEKVFYVSDWWGLLFILVAKVVEVSSSTLRIILMSKGYRKEAALLSFVEIILWVFIASTVLNGVSEEPIKGIVYAIGFSLGIYVGGLVEKMLAFGKVLIQVITNKDQEKALVDMIRSNHYAVTTIVGQGKDSEKAILLIFANRKGKEALLKKIYEQDESVMIVTNDVANIQGGYVRGLKGVIK